MIPLDWIFDLRLVGFFGPVPAPGEPTDEYGTAVSDVYFTFSKDPGHFAIEVAWFRASGDIIPWITPWRGNDVTQ